MFQNNLWFGKGQELSINNRATVVDVSETFVSNTNIFTTGYQDGIVMYTKNDNGPKCVMAHISGDGVTTDYTSSSVEVGLALSSKGTYAAILNVSNYDVLIYKRTGYSWSSLTTITDATGIPSVNFSEDETRCVIGFPYENSNAGYVKTYVVDSTLGLISPNTFNPPVTSVSYFGSDAVISNDNSGHTALVVQSSNHCYFYREDTLTLLETFQHNNDSFESGTQFGQFQSCAINPSGDWVLIPYYSTPGFPFDDVYKIEFYQRSNDTWSSAGQFAPFAGVTGTNQILTNVEMVGDYNQHWTMRGLNNGVGITWLMRNATKLQTYSSPGTALGSHCTYSTAPDNSMEIRWVDGFTLRIIGPTKRTV